MKTNFHLALKFVMVISKNVTTVVYKVGAMCMLRKAHAQTSTLRVKKKKKGKVVPVLN
jgi:hypothetical protein